MNAASDESPDERMALAVSTASPGQADPETLIIGHDPRAARNTAATGRSLQEEPGRGQARSGGSGRAFGCSSRL
jgi:hypothetical protein